MSIFNAVGTISSVLFLCCLVGLWQQIQRIRQAKRSPALSSRSARSDGAGSIATGVLSLNGFVSSFLAFYSFFLDSFFLDPINPYLLGTRLFATSLTLWIIAEIHWDRRTRTTLLTLLGCIGLMGGAFALLALRDGAYVAGRTFSIALVIIATGLMLQGGLHQVAVIRQAGSTGNLSLRMNQLFLIKDLSNLAFGFAMGILAGWPLLLMAGVSASLKLAILCQFRIYGANVAPNV